MQQFRCSVHRPGIFRSHGHTLAAGNGYVWNAEPRVNGFVSVPPSTASNRSQSRQADFPLLISLNDDQITSGLPTNQQLSRATGRGADV